MSRISIYKQVMREYERNRNQAAGAVERNRQALYEKIPRIQEIDEFLPRLGIQLTKSVLSGENTPELVNKLREESNRLQQEKKRIMAEHGYGENYLRPAYKCSICEDTGYIENMKKCTCLSQKLIDRYYEQSNLAGVLKQENFDMFDFRFYSEKVDDKYGISPLTNMQKVYEKCMNFVTDFDNSFSNLLFFGDTGLGKTFLCNCIAKDLLDLGKTCLYVTAPRMFKKIEDFRFNRDEQENPGEQLEMVYSVDLLIIDDLGSEFSTVITNTELFNILNTRLLEKRPVIISTNLSIQKLKDAYTDRIASRLYGNYESLRLFGDDIRVKKKLLGK